MTAQTELGALNREYYALIARNLRTFYTIATSKFKRNSVLRRIRDMVVSNYNFIAKHASPLKSGTTIASEFNEATSVEIRQQRSVEGNESESEEEALSKFLSAVAHWTNISIDEQNEFENQNWMSSTINNNFSLMKPTDDLDDHTNEPNTKNATRQTPLPKRNQDV
nr:hypothetical transcript [Hymenolepis microstoma]